MDPGQIHCWLGSSRPIGGWEWGLVRLKKSFGAFRRWKNTSDSDKFDIFHIFCGSYSVTFTHD